VRLSPLLLSLALSACATANRAAEAPMLGGESPGSSSVTANRVDFARPVRPGPVGWVFYGLAKGIKWLFIWE
jgi:hypothetical protein